MSEDTIPESALAGGRGAVRVVGREPRRVTQIQVQQEVTPFSFFHKIRDTSARGVIERFARTYPYGKLVTALYPELLSDGESTERQSGTVVWLFGLPGAGKSTLATQLASRCRDRGRQEVVLDGDAFRRGVSGDLGFSPSERTENIRRAAEVAALIADAGLIAIVAFISPLRAHREMTRRIVREKAPASDSWRFTSVRRSRCVKPGTPRVFTRAPAQASSNSSRAFPLHSNPPTTRSS